MYNVKNYTEPGGEKTVIGGTLEIKEGAQVTGLPSSGGSGEADLGFPKIFTSDGIVKLTADDPLQVVIQDMNIVRYALIANGIFHGFVDNDFRFYDDFTTKDEKLQWNRDHSTRSFDKDSMTLTITCNPDKLKEQFIDIFPYFNFGNHKYVLVGFYLTRDESDPEAFTKVNYAHYYDTPWSSLGLSTTYVYAAVSIDQLLPGMNKEAYCLQDGSHTRQIINVNLVLTDN